MKVIIDGLDGKVIVNPNEDEVKLYQKKKVAYEAQKAEWAKLVHEKTVTSDDYEVELVGNIGTSQDVQGVLDNGGEGVGLYRTEFLYMGRDTFPTEEEQFEAYKSVLERLGDKPVVVRTLDIGGDKELSYLNLPKEMNPFLGYRAIRLCLEMQAVLPYTITRSFIGGLSIFGNLNTMFR